MPWYHIFQCTKMYSWHEFWSSSSSHKTRKLQFLTCWCPWRYLGDGGSWVIPSAFWNFQYLDWFALQLLVQQTVSGFDSSAALSSLLPIFWHIFRFLSSSCFNFLVVFIVTDSSLLQSLFIFFFNPKFYTFSFYSPLFYFLCSINIYFSNFKNIS